VKKLFEGLDSFVSSLELSFCDGDFLLQGRILLDQLQHVSTAQKVVRGARVEGKGGKGMCGGCGMVPRVGRLLVVRDFVLGRPFSFVVRGYCSL